MPSTGRTMCVGLSGSPAVMSGWTMVTDALVSVVSNHSLSPIQPSAIRPLLALSVMILGVGWGDWNGNAGVLPFPPTPTHFLMVGHLAQLPLISRALFFPAVSLLLLECRSSLFIRSHFILQHWSLSSSDLWVVLQCQHINCW